VEHRLDLLSTLTDRVIVMDNGHVRMDGSPVEVFNSMDAQLMGIGVPKIVRLYHALGFRAEKPPLSVEDFAQYLRGLRND